MTWVRCVPSQSAEGRAQGELFRCPDCGELFRVKVQHTYNNLGFLAGTFYVWRRARWWHRWWFRKKGRSGA